MVEGHLNPRLFNHKVQPCSWLKSLGLKGPGLKLGIEKSGVEISFNLYCPNIYAVLKGLILELVLTKPDEGYFGMFMKKARRKEFDLAILNMAALVKITDHGDKDDTIIEDIKIAFGGSSQLLEYSGMHNSQ